MHNKFELTGNIVEIFDTNQVNGKFKKREFAIEIPHSSYPQTVLFVLKQENCEMIDDFSIGDKVTIDFNVRGRTWEAPDGTVKYFNSLDAWRVVRASEDHSYEHTDISGKGDDLSF